MSGGVDSSVAAALLKRQGYGVVGVFMKFWKAPGYGENRCCSLESEKRARLVAKILDIPFYVFNFEKEFKKRVVDYFLKEQKAGQTPNSCVVCNKEIKFGLMLEKALELGAEYIATGHYARKAASYLGVGPSGYTLLAALDAQKDQSYFLWKLNQKQLSRVLFPVGGYKRAKVEELARKFKLPFSGVKKSMEVCFVPADLRGFLKPRIHTDSGNIVDSKGNIIGRHDGLAFYTIGQRKGIGLSGGPYYVIGKNVQKNVLVVSKNEKDLLSKEIIVKEVNWISGKAPQLPLKVSVKIRYRSPSVPATISKIQPRRLKGSGIRPKASENTKYKILFFRPQRAVTPGQSAAFYLKGELLGGGVIL